MRLIKPYCEILSNIDRDSILQAIELAGRTCYKSEDKITNDSAPKFVGMIVNRGHLSVIEHQSVTVKFICDRGVSHELVRHRLCSFLQESTRYCNYGKDEFITFIIPPWITEDIKDITNLRGPLHIDYCGTTCTWLTQMFQAEERYNSLIKGGWRPEQARSVLPNSLKTEIVVTANLRQWKEMFRQRTSSAAHPQMRELMIPLRNMFSAELPEIFGTNETQSMVH